MSENPYFLEGQAAGRNAASWAFDGNTDLSTYAKVLQGFNDGNPEIMDMQPSPLSGEIAGESMGEILGHFVTDQDQDEAADSYEAGYSAGYWDEIQETCNYHLGWDENDD